ncbi:MAG: c-type cytochrome [Sulfurimonas sp.]|nr:c-type cytochrome [Sulfurimonas sp.]
MKTTTLTNTLKSILIAGAILSSTTLLADGGALYKKCAGCHGMNAEKVALGKSKVIANMSEADLNTAMNGYKDGSYGGPMKGLMKGQVARLSADDISSLSSYIASLKK